jgi:hypothetical protein
VASFGRLDSSSSSGIPSYACSLVHSELSWWDSKALCIYMSHICIMAVTTALDHLIKDVTGLVEQLLGMKHCR